MSYHSEELFDLELYKERFTMSKAKEQLTKDQYNHRLAAYKSRYGSDLLAWPRHLRDRLRKIEIVDEVKLEWRQRSLSELSPYGNTGVSEGVEKP